MRLGLQLFVFLIGVYSCFGAPVPYAESLRKLEELKGKLVQLEETLRNFDSELQAPSDGQLASRDLSPEDQALIDKHKSLQDKIAAELGKAGHTDADEDPEVPDAGDEEERRDAAHINRDLTPEEQAILDKHKSLQDKIAAALAKAGHTDADEDPEVPDADEEEEKRGLEDVLKDLSPEDKALLDKFKSKLSSINAVLNKGRPANDEDAEVDDADEDSDEGEEETVLRRGNSNVFTYMSELADEDQELLRRMRSKIPNLQIALDKKNRMDHDMYKRGQEEDIVQESSEEAETVLRRGNANVFTYMSGLSEKDQQLLRRMRSKIPYLQLALDKKNKRNNGAFKRAQEEDNSESLVSESEEDDKLAQFEQNLSPDDLALLKALKSKLHFLKDALHKRPPPVEEDESASQSEAEDVPGADAGPLEDRREAKMDGWNQQPLSDDDLGMEESDLEERCPCQKHKGSEKRCACDKEFQERCPKCHQHDAIVKLLEERCPTCHKGRTPDKVVEEVQSRLMNDIEFAKANGVSVSELIDRIKSRAAERVVNEERELEILATM